MLKNILYELVKLKGDKCCKNIQGFKQFNGIIVIVVRLF